MHKGNTPAGVWVGSGAYAQGSQPHPPAGNPPLPGVLPLCTRWAETDVPRLSVSVSTLPPLISDTLVTGLGRTSSPDSGGPFKTMDLGPMSWGEVNTLSPNKGTNSQWCLIFLFGFPLSATSSSDAHHPTPTYTTKYKSTHTPNLRNTESNQTYKGLVKTSVGHA